MPWLSWQDVGGLPSLPYHEWMAFVIATRPRIDGGILVDDRSIGLAATDRVYQGILGQGFFLKLGAGPQTKQRVDNVRRECARLAGDPAVFVDADFEPTRALLRGVRRSRLRVL